MASLCLALTSCKANISSNACMIVRISLRRPPSSVRPSSPCSQRPSHVNSKREFSSFPPARNISDDSEFLDYLDDDNGNGRGGRLVAPIGLMDQPSDMPQRQRNARNARSRSAVRIALSPEPPKPHKPPEPPESISQRITKIDLKLSSVSSKVDSLIPKYCEIKFSNLVTGISQATAKIQLLTREYRLVAAAINRRLEHERRWRKMDSIESIVHSLPAKLAELDRLKDEFFAPVISARRRVNSDLEASYRMQHDFDDLVESTNAVTGGFYHIKRALGECGSPSFESKVQPKHFFVHQNEYQKAAHNYREALYIRMISESRFAMAWPFMFFLAPVARLRMFREIKTAEFLKAGKHPRAIRQLNDLDFLRGFYFPHCESQSNHLLDMHRRQLDVMAHFVSADSVAAALYQETISLAEFFTRNRKDIIHADLRKHQERLTMFRFHYTDQRAEFRNGLVTLWHINWMRLQAEDKLQALGGWSTTPEIGLVLARPLTSDLIRFRQWVHLLKSNTDRMRELQNSKSLPNASLDEFGEQIDIDDGGRKRKKPAPLSSPGLLDLPKIFLPKDYHNKRGLRILSNLDRKFDRMKAAALRKEQRARLRNTHKRYTDTRVVDQHQLPLNKQHPSTGKSRLWPKWPKYGIKSGSQEASRPNKQHPSTSKSHLWAKWPKFGAKSGPQEASR